MVDIPVLVSRYCRRGARKPFLPRRRVDSKKSRETLADRLILILILIFAGFAGLSSLLSCRGTLQVLVPHPPRLALHVPLCTASDPLAVPAAGTATKQMEVGNLIQR
jgi:hypothetical protein